MATKILIVSGEASGDLHGSHLMRAIKELDPGVEFKGIGGEKMRAEGLEGLDSTLLSVVGFVEVIEKFPEIRRAFNELKRMLDAGGFDGVVLIDYPDFNLRFAREARKRRVPVVYYISPQVWAWRRGRVSKIARLIDKMIVVFPFEAECYRGEDLDVEYVGHPLCDIARTDKTKEEARAALGLDADCTSVALLPGSRSAEIRRLLPPMLGAAAIVAQGLGRDIEVLLPAADSIEDALLDEFLTASPVKVRLLRGRMYEVLRASDAALVASGTATLETALIGTPMVITYKVSPVSFLIGKLLIKLDNMGLPNIVSGRRVVPELIQGAATAEAMAKELLSILTDAEVSSAMVRSLAEIRTRLGGTGAAVKAARAVLKTLSLDSGASGNLGASGDSGASSGPGQGSGSGDASSEKNTRGAVA